MKTHLQVKLQVLTCTNCELHQQCRTPVPMVVGSSGTNRFTVLGEAPGRVEDYRGEPFIGPAGQLMRRELAKTGLDVEAATWLNVVSCWPKRQPPTPNRDEVNACHNNLIDQLELTGDQWVLLAGNTALKAVLPSAQMMYMVGGAFEAHDRKWFSIYHPSYVLQNKDALNGWRLTLAWFAGLVTGNLVLDQSDEITSTRCLYCNTRAEHGEHVCRKHRATWLRDNRAMTRTPEKPPTLF